MKKTVLTFGLISGAVSSAMMLLTIPFLDRIGFGRAEVIGYSTILASFLLVFFGVRSYRERAGGILTFGRAFTVGILITLVSCVCYVATWQVVHRTVAADFGEKYGAYLIEETRRSGATAEQVEARIRQVTEFKRLYGNPLFSIGMTFLEPFPIGLLVTLVSAASLRRKPAGTAPAAPGIQSRLV